MSHKSYVGAYYFKKTSITSPRKRLYFNVGSFS